MISVGLVHKTIIKHCDFCDVCKLFQKQNIKHCDFCNFCKKTKKTRTLLLLISITMILLLLISTIKIKILALLIFTITLYWCCSGFSNCCSPQSRSGFPYRCCPQQRFAGYVCVYLCCHKTILKHCDFCDVCNLQKKDKDSLSFDKDIRIVEFHHQDSPCVALDYVMCIVFVYVYVYLCCPALSSQNHYKPLWFL